MKNYAVFGVDLAQHLIRNGFELKNVRPNFEKTTIKYYFAFSDELIKAIKEWRNEK